VDRSVGFLFSVQLTNTAKLATGRGLAKRRKRKKMTMKSTQRRSRVMGRV
jgi:hypothetical protein